MTPDQLAAHLNLSEQNLRKVCTRLKIPLPAGEAIEFRESQIQQIRDFLAAQGDAETPRSSSDGSRPMNDRSLGDRSTSGGGRSDGPGSREVVRPTTSIGYGPTGGAGTGPQSPPSGIAASVAVLDLERGFEVLGTLGEGGMGSVLHAIERATGREVAIKRLNSGGASDAALEKLISEFRVGRDLSHLNIVRFYAVNQDQDGPYFTMEYVDGASLSKRLKQGPMRLEDALDVFTPLAEALQHAHEQNLVHRDIKPANILVTKGNMPKLADFGLVMEGKDAVHAGDFVGTIDFMAPEQRVDSRNCTALSDQWSFAATMYYALTKKPPREFDPADVPAAVRPILTRALQDAPIKRYMSMQEMAQALQRCEMPTSPVFEAPFEKPASGSAFTPLAEPSPQAGPSNLALTAAILGSIYGTSPSLLMFWLAVVGAGIWWGRAYLVQRCGFAAGQGMVLGALAGFGLTIIVSTVSLLGMLASMAVGAALFGAAAAVMHWEAARTEMLFAPIAAACSWGTLWLLWLVSSPIFSTAVPTDPSPKQANGNVSKEMAVSGSSPVVRTVELHQQLLSWEPRIEIELQNIEFRNDRRMRWNFAFHNKSGTDSHVWISAGGRTYVTDSGGTQYKALQTSEGSTLRVRLPDGVNKKIWIDFQDAPETVIELTAVFDRDGTYQKNSLQRLTVSLSGATGLDNAPSPSKPEF